MKEIRILVLLCLIHQCLSAITEDPRVKEEAYQRQLREYRLRQQRRIPNHEQLSQQQTADQQDPYRYYRQSPRHREHNGHHAHRHAPRQHHHHLRPHSEQNESRFEQLRRERQNRVYAEQRRRSVEFPKATGGQLRAHVENDYLATNRIRPEQKWDARPKAIDNEILNTEKYRSEHYKKERERLDAERLAKDRAHKERELESKRQEKYRLEAANKDRLAQEYELKRKEKLRLEKEREEKERLAEERRQEELRKADEEARRMNELRRAEEDRRRSEERRQAERARDEERRKTREEEERRKAREEEEWRKKKEEAHRRAFEEKMRRENELREVELRRQDDLRKERERLDREWRARQTTAAPIIQRQYAPAQDAYQAQLAAYQKKQEMEMLRKIQPTIKPIHHHHHHHHHGNHLNTNRIESNAIPQEPTQQFRFIEDLHEVQRAVERGETWMVLIYAPWCGHSRKAIREYPQIAADIYKVTGRKITVAAFNVKTFEHTPVPKTLFTRYIPTIRLFGPDIPNYIEYDGYISAEWVIPWLNEEVSMLSRKRS